MKKKVIEELNRLKEDVFANAVNHGWHEEDKPDEHFMCLVISELCEAVQADRIGRRCDIHLLKSMYKNIIETPVEEFVYKNGIGFRMYIPNDRVIFEKFVKDSVEDELADAVIRLLDFCGLRGIELISVPHKKSDKYLSFTQRVYEIIRFVANYRNGSYSCSNTIDLIFTLAEDMEIDLMRFIKMKMAYNIHREYKHGKAY